MPSTVARPFWFTTTCARTKPISTASTATGRSAPSSASAADFEYEIITKEDWFGRRLVADKFRDGRVFLCGDAAHLWVPYAGYGMNAGLADAADLGWLLAADLNGWGGPGILDAYASERQPITEQVSHFAMNHAHAMAKQRGAVPRRDRGRYARGRGGPREARPPRL